MQPEECLNNNVDLDPCFSRLLEPFEVRSLLVFSPFSPHKNFVFRCPLLQSFFPQAGDDHVYRHTSDGIFGGLSTSKHDRLAGRRTRLEFSFAARVFCLLVGEERRFSSCPLSNR